MATSNNDRISSARLLDTLKGLQASRHLGSEPEVNPQTNEKTKHTIKQDYLPNADWNVNDPDADGYVEGRTHWVEVAETGVIPSAGTYNSLEEIQAQFNSVEPSVVYVCDAYPQDWDGNTFPVTLDDYDGEPLAVLDKEFNVEGLRVLGPSDWDGDTSNPPEYLFIFNQEPHYEVNTVMQMTTGKNYRWKGVVENIHKLDKKFYDMPTIDNYVKVNVPWSYAVCFECTFDELHYFLYKNELGNIHIPTKKGMVYHDENDYDRLICVFTDDQAIYSVAIADISYYDHISTYPYVEIYVPHEHEFSKISVLNNQNPSQGDKLGFDPVDSLDVNHIPAIIYRNNDQTFEFADRLVVPQYQAIVSPIQNSPYESVTNKTVYRDVHALDEVVSLGGANVQIAYCFLMPFPNHYRKKPGTTKLAIPRRLNSGYNNFTVLVSPPPNKLSDVRMIGTTSTDATIVYIDSYPYLLLDLSQTSSYSINKDNTYVIANKPIIVGKHSNNYWECEVTESGNQYVITPTRGQAPSTANLVFIGIGSVDEYPYIAGNDAYDCYLNLPWYAEPNS